MKASGTQNNPEVVQDSSSTLTFNCFFTVTPHQEKESRLFLVLFKTSCVTNYSRKFKYLIKMVFSLTVF